MINKARAERHLNFNRASQFSGQYCGRETAHCRDYAGNPLDVGG